MKISDPRESIDGLLFKWKSRIVQKEQGDALSLYVAIRDYREFITPECFLYRFPECEDQKEHFELLFAHFKSSTQQELADLAIEAIHKNAELEMRLNHDKQ